MAPTYHDEPMRALARPDIADLRKIVAAYYTYSKLSGKERETFHETCQDAWESFYLAGQDPDLGMALVVLSADLVDDPFFLMLVAAGPLEDLLVSSDTRVIERVVGGLTRNSPLPPRS